MKKFIRSFLSTVLISAAVCSNVSAQVRFEKTQNGFTVEYSDISYMSEEAVLEELYNNAVKDALTVEPDEILPVINITPESNMVTWNNSKDKILLLTFHKYPDSYPAGDNVSLAWGDVWTFTDKEFEAWFDKNNTDIDNWGLRLNQLLGLPPETSNICVTGFWVSPENVIRPAYVTDITSTEMKEKFTDSVDADYKAWFDNNIIWSYFDSAYPWTRLGYTYDWADNGTEYGLSEFIVKKDSDVGVEFTYGLEDFINHVQNNDLW